MLTFPDNNKMDNVTARKGILFFMGYVVDDLVNSNKRLQVIILNVSFNPQGNSVVTVGVHHDCNKECKKNRYRRLFFIMDKTKTRNL